MFQRSIRNYCVMVPNVQNPLRNILEDVEYTITGAFLRKNRDIHFLLDQSNIYQDHFKLNIEKLICSNTIKKDDYLSLSTFNTYVNNKFSHLTKENDITPIVRSVRNISCINGCKHFYSALSNVIKDENDWIIATTGDTLDEKYQDRVNVMNNICCSNTKLIIITTGDNWEKTPINAICRNAMIGYHIEINKLCTPIDAFKEIKYILGKHR